MRNLMPVKKLEDWRRWLFNNGYEVVENPVDFSPFGVRVNGKTLRVYVRDGTHAGGETVHASLHGELINLARAFLGKRKQTNDR